MTDSQDLDAIDEAILEQLRTTYAAVDPPPDELDERVRFAIALESIDVEVARLQEDMMVGSGARGTERTRTITFDSESVTIMIAITDGGAGRVRVDGWLAPAGRRRVEMRTGASPSAVRQASHVVTTEETGRFVFDGVDHGLAQLLVHRDIDSAMDVPAMVVTPPLML